MAIHDKNRRWKGKCPKRKDSSEHLLLYLKKKLKLKSILGKTKVSQICLQGIIINF